MLLSTSNTTSLMQNEKAPKRKQVLPKVPRGARCGRCHTCLNPQLKKACQTVREQQIKQHGGEENLAAYLYPTPSTGSGTSSSPRASSQATAPSSPVTSAPAALPPPVSDVVEEQLRPILLNTGGVKAANAPKLASIMTKVNTLKKRMLLVTIIERSDGAARQVLKGGQGFTILHTWVQQARDQQQNDLLEQLLKLLGLFEMDVATLRRVPIGKTVNKLCSHEHSSVRQLAIGLIMPWKALAAQDTASKRARDTDGPEEDTKRAKTEPGSTLARQASVPPKAARPAAPAPADDMFAEAPKAAKASLKDAVPRPAKIHTLQRIEVQPNGKPGAAPGRQPSTIDSGTVSPRALTPESATPTATEAARTDDAAVQPQTELEAIAHDGAQVEPMDVEDSQQDVNDVASDLAVAGTNSAFKAGTGTVSSAAGLEAMQVDAGTPTAGTSTDLTDPADSSLALITADTVIPAAAEQTPDDTAAAVKVPKKKKKKLTWAREAELRKVRWFLKEDPPEAAQADAQHEEGPSHSAGAHPPQFVARARREHQLEADMMRKHKEEVQRTERELEQRLSGMTALRSYTAPPILQLAVQDVPVALGEDSVEVDTMQQYEATHAPVVFTLARPAPPSPAEPQLLEYQTAEPIIVPWVPSPPQQQQLAQPMPQALPVAVGPVPMQGAPLAHGGLEAGLTAHSHQLHGLGPIDPGPAHGAPMHYAQPGPGQTGPGYGGPSLAAGPSHGPHPLPVPEYGHGGPGQYVEHSMDGPARYQAPPRKEAPARYQGPPRDAFAPSARGPVHEHDTDPYDRRRGGYAEEGRDYRDRDRIRRPGPAYHEGPAEAPPGRHRDADVRGDHIPLHTKLCAFYNSSQGCKLGNNCRFRHIPGDRAPQAILDEKRIAISRGGRGAVPRDRDWGRGPGHRDGPDGSGGYRGGHHRGTGYGGRGERGGFEDRRAWREREPWEGRRPDGRERDFVE